MKAQLDFLHSSSIGRKPNRRVCAELVDFHVQTCGVDLAIYQAELFSTAPALNSSDQKRLKCRGEPSRRLGTASIIWIILGLAKHHLRHHPALALLRPNPLIVRVSANIGPCTGY